MKKLLLQTTALSLLLCAASIQGAATKYWDISGATPGSGGPTPSGNWDTTSSFWTTDSTGSSATTTFASGDAAVFSAGTDATGAYTINVPAAVTAASVTAEEGTVTLATSAALTTQTIVVNSPAAFFTKAALSLTVAAGGTCTVNGGTIGNSNTGTGGSFFGSGTANSNMKIVLGTGGGHVSANGGANIVTIYTGLISGTGPLTVDGSGIFRLTTTTATYSGATLINGRLQLSTTANVLPSTTDMTINSGGTFDDEAVQTIGSLSGLGSLLFVNSATVLTCGNASSTTFSGPVSGPGTFTKVGAGTLTISGNDWANTGPVNINVGSIKYGNSLAGLSSSSTVTIAAGATLDMNGFSDTFGALGGAGSVINNNGSTGLHIGANNNASSVTFSGTIDGTGNLEKFGTGTQVLSGVNTFSGKTTISGGLLTINNQNTTTDLPLGTPPTSPVADQLIFNGGALSLGTAHAIIFDVNRGVTLNAGGGQVQGSSSDLTIPGNIVGVGGFIKTNTANLTLSGQNTFAGDFKIYGGGVRFNGDDTAGHGNVMVGPTTGLVTLRNLAPTVTSTLTNNITLNGAGTSDIDVTCAAGNTFTLGGNIGGNGFLVRGRASGASGNVVLLGNNSGWSGGLFWGRGPLTLGHKNALGTGTLTCTNLVAGESNVLMSATALTGANAVGNAVNLTGLMIVAGANDLELSGPMTLATGNNAITNRSTATFAISGAIGGAGALTIAGSGATVFSGASANTYAGATTVNGSLDVQKDGGLSTGNVTVGNGATLTLEGGVNNTYIASTANLLLNGAAPVVNLAFTGTPNTINGLSFDGGASFKAAGTWGAIGSGAQHEDARFTGTGMLNVTTGPTTTTALASSSPAASYGAPLTLTATVTASAGTAAGAVEFYDGATLIGSAATVGGVANLNAAGLLNVAGSPHSLTATFLANNDFAGSTSSAISQTISAATVTASIMVSGKTYDGTTSATIVNRSLIGVFGADDVTLGTTGTAEFADKNVGTGKSVAVSGLAISGATAPNYVLASDTVNTSANINAVVLTVSGLSADSKAYDGNTSATINGTPVLSAGVVGSEDVTLTGTPVGNFATRSPGTSKAVNVTGLSLSGADIANYALTSPTLNADITAPPPLTVTGVTANNKPFDGTTNATLVLTNAALVGVVGTDTVTLVTSNAAAGFDTPDVADSKTVTVTGLEIVGADATNYSLTQPTATADIKLALNVTNIVASNKVYDGGTAANVSFAGAGLDGVQGTDDVTLDTTGASAAFADKNVGTGKTVTVSGLTIGGADASKYLLVTITASADITAAPLTVSGLAAQNRMYDGGTTASVTGTPALFGVIGTDDVSLSGTAAGSFADKAVGVSKPVTVSGLSISGADAINYAFTLPTLNADITSAPLTVTGLSAQSRAYDGGTVASVTGTPALFGVIGTDDVSVTGTAAGSFADKAVGIAKPVIVSGLSTTGADAGNYALTLPTLNADITPAGLTVTGLSASSKVYDRTTAATITGTPALAGVFGTDDVSPTGTPAGTFADAAVGTSKPVTVTGLSTTGADAANYALTLPTLNANITPAPLTVSGLSAQNRAYDGGTTASVTGTPALSGVIAPDDASLTGMASGSFADKAVGTSKPVTVAGLSIIGADAGNYALTLPTLNADITSAPLTVTGLSAQNKVYDGTTSATLSGTPALSGVIGTDDVSLSGTASGVFTDKNVGTAKAVPVSGLSTTGADAGNYALTLPTLNADITALSTTNGLISSLNPSIVDSNVTFTATLAGNPPAADGPTGNVVFLANGVPFATNALVSGSALASTTSLPLGTNTVSAEYAGDGNFLGSTGTLQQVVETGGTCSGVNMLTGIANNHDGTLTLSFIGTPQAQYYVLSSANVTAPISSWAILAGSTNTVTNVSGAWTLTVTNAAPVQYYRSGAVAPCP